MPAAVPVPAAWQAGIPGVKTAISLARHVRPEGFASLKQRQTRQPGPDSGPHPDSGVSATAILESLIAPVCTW